MQKIIVIASILIIASINDCFGQRQRRVPRSSSERAAYGISTVSGNGKIRKGKKVRPEKALKRKMRAAKRKPGFRKVQNWAG
jgi:hypothetical protein